MVAVQGFDINGCIYHWNPVSEKLYGMGLKEVLEKPFHELFLDKKEAGRFLADLKKVFEEGLPVETREFVIITAGGEKKWVYSSMFPVFEDGRCLEAIRMEMDITERKKVEERLEYLSTHDPLTGLYNRGYFEEAIHRLDTPHSRPVSIIVCDVDDLKLVNDTMGHDKGDDLLKAAAAAIRLPFVLLISWPGSAAMSLPLSCPTLPEMPPSVPFAVSRNLSINTTAPIHSSP